ncbi:MAG: helix-turn-helix domain-containing protein [Prevotella sp.]|nr:helix-turn-helix domain-containing protein [Prevotella sp.]
MKKKLSITTAFLLACVCTLAQTGRLFDANQQLSSSFVGQVYLDNDGFIWAATRNGLNRYDGYQFVILKKEKELYNEMASNYVNCFLQDRNGLFYLGMWGHLQTYDGQSFRNVEVKAIDPNNTSCFVTCFLERKNGEIWAGTSGVGVLKIDDREHAHQVSNSLRDIHTVNHLAEDKLGHIWIVTRDNGLLEYDGRQVTSYFTEAPLRVSLHRVCVAPSGQVYVGTTNDGLYVREGQQFRHIDNTGTKPISALYFNSHGELMIGYDGGGLGIYDPKTGELVDNPYYSTDIDLSTTKVYSITEDRIGNIWLGLLQKGLFMQPGTPPGFGYMGYKLGDRNKIGSACVISTFIDSHGRIWIGTDKDGLYCFSHDKQLLKHYKEGFPESIMTIAEDHNGHIWIGSYNQGGGWIDPTTTQYHRYPFTQESLSIFDICVDRNNRVWLGTMRYGLLMLDQSTNQLISYTKKDKAEKDRQVNSISNDYISQISLSPDEHRIYVSTTMGLCCLDIESGSWTKYFGQNCINYGTPVRIAKEYSGKVWVGTNDGLYCYDPSSKQLRLYTEEKGLSDNGIASIEQDRQGRLWIGTDHGLRCHDIKSGDTHNYFIDNGLQSNEFSDGASCISPQGTMLFGGVGGVTWFDPESITDSKWDATVELSRFCINGQPVNKSTQSGSYHITDTTIIASKRFDLSYHDNSFTIQLSTLTYDNPEHITYLYSINNEPYLRLQPGANELMFTHLSPGTYNFRVKAERNGIETPEKEFTVVIHGPWYRSTIAYLLYLLALGLAIWQLLRMRDRKEQNRLSMQQHIHAQEMSDAKLRFFMNISHEIRTPMTLIITPLISLIKNEKDAQKKSILQTIKRNSERILHLINQMMDLRKIDQGQMVMHMSETDLVPFINELYSLFEHQAKNKGIHLSLECDSDSLPIWIDRQNFDKVVMNILSNAFKFTPTGGNIAIRVTHDDKEARIAISDDGEKIPEGQLAKIFERFYQTDSTINGQQPGTGIGLDLAKSLVELHHGTISAHNLEKGCEFVVTLPLGDQHLRAEEKINDKPISEQAKSDVALPVSEGTNTPEHKDHDHYMLVIAEDDDEIRTLLCKEFEQDYDVKACSNGREALVETLRSKPDLVISDVMMPEMDGHTLCSKIKSNPDISHTPVILLTAKNLDEDKLTGLETGADAYIVKPFNMDILRRTIINIISSHRLLRLKYERNDQLEDKVDNIDIKSPDEKLLERVMNTINKHISDSDLNVEMIAEEVGISRVHLHRKMKELTGQTPHDFIRNIRLKRAANLLVNQGMNVTEVMYACGFSNTASFSTLFKKFYGLSPRDYMKEHGK